MRPRFNTTHFAFVALALACCLSAGCRRAKAPGFPVYNELIAQSTSVPVTPMHCEALRTLKPSVTDLRGIAIDKADRLFVLGVNRVEVMSTDGASVRTFEVDNDARAIALDDAGNPWIVQQTRVLKYDASGKKLAAWGVEGAAPGAIRHATSIALRDTNVYVADARNLCIHRYDVTGDFINEIGKRDRDASVLGLLVPSPYLDIVIDAAGNVIVGNTGRLRVETYTPDGTLIAKWGESGLAPERFCGCCNPTALALTSTGYIVTAEKGIPRVKVYDTAGKLLAWISPTHFPHDTRGMDLAVDSADRIYVMEPNRAEIHVFQLKDGPAPTESREGTP